MASSTAVQLKHPFRVLMIGPSFSGKTHLFSYLVKNQFQTVRFPAAREEEGFDRIVVFYSVFQKIYTEWSEYCTSILFHRGLPKSSSDFEKYFVNKNEKNLIFIDDVGSTVNDLSFVSKIFTIYSHHSNSSIVMASHALFGLKAKESTIITKNASGIFLLPQTRDLTGINLLSRQVNPSDPGLLLAAYLLACSPDKVNRERREGKCSFLLVDFEMETPSHLRLRETISKAEPAIYFERRKDEAENEKKEEDESGIKIAGEKENSQTA